VASPKATLSARVEVNASYWKLDAIMKIKRTIGIVKSLLSGARSQIFSSKHMPLDPDDDLSLMEPSFSAELEDDFRQGEEPKRASQPTPGEDPPAAPLDEVGQAAPTPPAELSAATVGIHHPDRAQVDADKEPVDHPPATSALADEPTALAPASPVEIAEDNDLWDDAIAAADDEDGADFTTQVDDVDDDIWPDNGAGPDDEDDRDGFEDMEDEATFALDPVFAPAAPSAPTVKEAVDDWRIDRRALDLAVLLPFPTASAAEAALPRIHLLLETFPHAASHGAMRRRRDPPADRAYRGGESRLARLARSLAASPVAAGRRMDHRGDGRAARRADLAHRRTVARGPRGDAGDRPDAW
jgi:hypothetical protein